jgi:hypothetical protein
LAFKVDLRTEPDPEPKTVSLIFRWAGDWKLTRVLLPLDDALVEANRPTEAAAAPAAEKPAPPVVAQAPPAPAPVQPAHVRVGLISKNFKPSNPSAGEYQDEIRFSLSIANIDAKDIRAFDGTLAFTDLLGNDIMSMKLAINDPIGAGKSIIWNGNLKYNQFIDAHQHLRNESRENLNVNFVFRKILYVDGTTIEATAQ